MAVETEVMREIWDDDLHGDRIEVGPDRDGLDMVEVRQRTAKGEVSDRMQFTVAQARAVADAMLRCAMELDPTKGEDDGE